MGKILATLLFVLVSCGVQAQRSADAAVTFRNLITNFYVDEVSGNVIVREGGAVKCYNPQADSIVWRVKKEDLPHGNARQFHVSNAEEKGKPYDASEHIWGIPETPYIETQVGGITAIIDITNGSTVLASSELPFDAAHVSYIVDDDLFMFVTRNAECILTDLKSKTTKWQTQLICKKTKEKNFSIDNVRMVATDAYIYACVDGIINKLQKTDGKLLFHTDKVAEKFCLMRNGDIAVAYPPKGVLGFSNYLNLLDGETGKPRWNADIKHKSIAYMADFRGDLLMLTGCKLNLYSPDDGSARWPERVRILFSQENSVLFLDTIGNNRLLFITEDYADMIDLATGKTVYAKSMDLSGNVSYCYDEKSDKFILCSSDNVYQISKDDAEGDTLAPCAHLAAKEAASIVAIQPFDWGFAFVGQSDVIGLKANGDTLYHRICKEPEGGARKFWKGVGAATTLLGVITDDDETFNDGVEMHAEHATRFNALKFNNSHAFLINKNADGIKELVKIRLEDGAKMGSIKIGDNAPIYAIDPETDDVYCAVGNELQIYRNRRTK